MHTSYRAVDAVRKARYHRPEARRPVSRKNQGERYRRPPRRGRYPRRPY